MEEFELTMVIEHLNNIATRHFNAANSLAGWLKKGKVMILSDAQKEDFLRRRDELSAVIKTVAQVELVIPHHLYVREFATRIRNVLTQIIEKGKITPSIFNRGPNKIPIS